MSPRTMTAPHSTRPRILAPGQGDGFSLMGLHIVPKVRSADSGGAYTLLEQAVPPDAGTPLHRLSRGHKTIYVADGEFEIRIGGADHSAVPGSCFSIPAGIDHSFRNVGSRPGKLLVTVSPAGHELYLEELARLMAGGTPDRREMAALMADHGVEILES